MAFRAMVIGGLALAAIAVILAVRGRPGGATASSANRPPAALHPVFSPARPLPGTVALAYTHGVLWATRWSEQLPAAVLKLDPATLHVIGRVRISASEAGRRGRAAHKLRPPHAARFGSGIPVLTLRAAGGLWVAVNYQGPVGQLWQLDPRTGRIISRAPLPREFLPVVGAASGHTLWLATLGPADCVIRRVDLRPA
jgi:hypothetical protein